MKFKADSSKLKVQGCKVDFSGSRFVEFLTCAYRIRLIAYSVKRTAIVMEFHSVPNPLPVGRYVILLYGLVCPDGIGYQARVVAPISNDVPYYGGTNVGFAR